MINFSLIAIFGVCASIDHSKVAIFFFISASAVSYLCFDGYKQLSIKLYNKTKEAANALA
jgi:threonine/homoserine/homoserine lactone efflux protein